MSTAADIAASPGFPPAWLGYKCEHGETVARVCAWCASKNEAEAEARRLKVRVSHTVCPACAQRQFAALLGEPISPPTLNDHATAECRAQPRGDDGNV